MEASSSETPSNQALPWNAPPLATARRMASCARLAVNLRESRVQGRVPPSDSEWTSKGMEAMERAAPVAMGERPVARTVRFSVRPEMQAASIAAKRSGRRVALVPTMGALHEGHVALMRKARDSGAAVVVSVYVNPTQFGPNEDFKQYPRDLEADARLCEHEGVDAVFAPTDDEMYPGGIQSSVIVEETVLTRRLEGERRPGHFRGVCTVVTKLFNIVQPDIKFFGQMRR